MSFTMPENRTEWKAFVKQNKTTLIVVKCFATWCQPCKTISEPVEKMFEELDVQKKLFINLDVDKQADIARSMYVRKMPTILTYVDGELCMAHQGSNLEEIESMLDFSVKQHKDCNYY